MGFDDLYSQIVFTAPRVNALNSSAGLTGNQTQRERVPREIPKRAGHNVQMDLDYNPFKNLNKPSQNPIKSYGLDAIA